MVVVTYFCRLPQCPCSARNGALLAGLKDGTQLFSYILKPKNKAPTHALAQGSDSNIGS